MNLRLFVLALMIFLAPEFRGIAHGSPGARCPRPRLFEGFFSELCGQPRCGSDMERCLFKLGPYDLSFTGYQPLRSREAYCDRIPNNGPTIIVLDGQQDELRDMRIEVRILRNVGQKDDNENLAENTEVYIPPKKYKIGTVTFDHDFKELGIFVALVGARSDDGKEYVGRFPFVIGDADRGFFSKILAQSCRRASKGFLTGPSLDVVLFVSVPALIAVVVVYRSLRRRRMR